MAANQVEDDMDFKYSEEEERFRKELGEFLDNELTEEICRQNWEDKGVWEAGRDFARKLGAKGWVGMSWPKEYGGGEKSITYDFILLEELGKRGSHYPLDVGLMVGNTILRHGSPDLKKEFIPRILKGEIEFCLGYTEPQAGSDLASLKMSALEDGDYYVINGQKTFNTECHYAEYHWLAARTDPGSVGYKGISLFIVDINSPGITITPMWTLSGERTNEVFYDNVRVPKRRLVGEKNKGFYYVLEAIDHERITVFYPELLEFTLNALIQYCKQARRNGHFLIEDPLVRDSLGKIAIEIEVAKAVTQRAKWMAGSHMETTYEPTMVKLVVSELTQRLANTGMEILGAYAPLAEDSKWAPLKGRIGWLYRSCLIALIGGGTSEIDRNVLALRGLALPKG